MIGRSPQLGFNGLKVMQDALEFAESPAVSIGGPTRKPLRDDTGWCAEQDDAVELHLVPGWLYPFFEHQPITPMVNAVRALLTGSSSDVGLALAWSGLLLLICTPIAVLRYRRA